jgi:outer membrane protein TolC
MNARHFVRAIAYAIVSSVTVAGTSSAQGVKPAGDSLALSVEDAVRRAVEHNPDLAIVRLGVNAETARVAEARSAFGPVLSSAFGRSSNVAPPSNLLLGTSGVNTTEWFSSAGVRQRLPWSSGTWSVSWDASRTGTNSPFSSFDPSLQSGLQLAFSQPLLRDRAMDASRLQYIITRRDQATSELQFRESVVQTVAAVKQAYWTLKAQVANVMVQRRSLELAEDLVRLNRARVSVGQSPPLDLVQAEAEVAQRRDGLIRAETAASDAEDELRRLIMDPADATFWQVRLDPIDEPAGGVALPDVDTAVARALKERYDIGRAQQSLENAETQRKYFSSQRLADVRLEASYRAGGLGGSQLLRSGQFPGTISGRLDTGFGDVLGQLFNNNYPTWSLGVTVSRPLGHSYEDAGLARAEVDHQRAAQAIASLQLRVAESIRQAARQVHSTTERMDAARAGQTLAEQRFQVEQRRFEAGLSTSFLVTQAQRDLLQAQVNLLQATLDHQSALVTFEAVQLAPPATGERLVVSGADVVVQPTPTPGGLFRQGGS